MAGLSPKNNIGKAFTCLITLVISTTTAWGFNDNYSRSQNKPDIEIHLEVLEKIRAAELKKLHSHTAPHHNAAEPTKKAEKRSNKRRSAPKKQENLNEKPVLHNEPAKTPATLPDTPAMTPLPQATPIAPTQDSNPAAKATDSTNTPAPSTEPQKPEIAPILTPQIAPPAVAPNNKDSLVPLAPPPAMPLTPPPSDTMPFAPVPVAPVPTDVKPDNNTPDVTAPDNKANDRKSDNTSNQPAFAPAQSTPMPPAPPPALPGLPPLPSLPPLPPVPPGAKTSSLQDSNPQTMMVQKEEVSKIAKIETPNAAKAAELKADYKLVFSDNKTTILSTDNKKILDSLASNIKSDLNKGVRIIGYVDDKNDQQPANNIKERSTSLKRVIAIRNYIADIGIDAVRLKVQAGIPTTDKTNLNIVAIQVIKD